MAATDTRAAQSAHTIRKQTISIRAADPERVPELQSKIARLNTGTLHAIIEEVFDEFDHVDGFIAIESISLNLGSIPQVGLEFAVESRLRAALRQELSRLIFERPSTAVPSRFGIIGDDKIPRPVEQHFVGSPADANKAGQITVQLLSLLDSVLESDRAAILQMLHQTARYPGAVGQLTKQLHSGQLERLVRVLDPWNATTLILLAGKVVESYQASPVKKQSLDKIDQPVWNLVLTYLLHEPGTEFNRRQYVTWLLEKLAAETGLRLGDVIEIVAAGIEMLDRRRRVRTSLASVLANVVASADDAPITGTRRDDAGVTAQAESEQTDIKPVSSARLHIALDHVTNSLGIKVGKLLALHIDQEASDLPADRTEIGRQFSSRQLEQLARHLSQDPVSPHASLLLQRLSGGLLEAMLSSLDQGEEAALLKAALLAAWSSDNSASARLVHANALIENPDDAQTWKAEASPLHGADAPERQDERATIFLDYLRTGKLSIADRQKLNISSEIALNRAIRDSISANRAQFAEIVRNGSQAPKATKDWVTALEPETLALLACSVAQGWMRALLTGAQILTRIAGRARISSDRITKISSEFWQFHFEHLGELRNRDPNGTRLVADFLGSLSAPNQPNATRHKDRLRAVLTSDAPPKTSSAQADSVGSKESLDGLIAALELSDAATLRVIENLAPNVRRALLGKALTADPKTRRKIQALDDRQFRELLTLSLGVKTGHLLLITQTFLDAASLIGIATGASKARLTARLFLLECCADQATAKIDLTRLLVEFFENVVLQLASTHSVNRVRSISARRALKQRWLINVYNLARRRNKLRLSRSVNAILSTLRTLPKNGLGRSKIRALLPEQPTRQARNQSASRLAPEAKSSQEDTPIQRHAEPDRAATGSRFRVGNAGLVLAAPFLPHLFAQCELLAEGDTRPKSWRDRAAYERAVLLTEYLVTNSSDISPTDLLLNKLVCGGAPNDVIRAQFEPDSHEIELCDGLLKAMLDNWEPLREGTSVDGLRETFLQRKGLLERGDEGWSLSVERKTLDVLLDQIGWGFRTIFLPWQSVPLQVAW